MPSRFGWKLTLLAVGALFASSRSAFAQIPTGIVEGKVTEAGSGRALPNAQVFVVGTTIGSVTNETGTYRITGAPARQAQVQVRLIGFAPVGRTIVIAANQTTTLNFELQVSALQLEQIVVTGTGQQVEVKKLGNTVATVTPPQNAPIKSAGELLQGREPGVVGLPSTGLTGQGSRIRIRGNASLSQSNEPIVFVDGVRINTVGNLGRNVSAGDIGVGSTSRLDDIDPSSIERVEILKGAAAATLYGTEASNGVIQIFTKKGISGAPRWNFQAEQAAITYPGDRVLPQAGFARTPGQADSLSKFWGRSVTPFQVFTIQATDRLWTTGYGTTLNGSVNGGTSGFTYFTAGRYAKEDGPMTHDLGPSTDENRKAQGQVNLGIVPFNNMRVGLRTTYVSVLQQTPTSANNIYGVPSLSLFSKPEQANCVLSDPGKTDPNYGVASPGRCKGPGNEFGNTSFATVKEAKQLQVEQSVGRFIGVVDASYTPSSNVTISATVGADESNDRASFFRAFGYNVDRFTGNLTQGSRAVNSRRDREYTLDSKVAWNTKPTEKITSDFVAGGQAFISRVQQNGGTDQNFPGPGIEIVGSGSQPVQDENFLSTVNGGFFAQEQVGLNNWIFTTFGGRYDYSSAFGKTSGGVFYPKVSISVVPSDLGGWRAPLGLGQLRLRAALGRSGRQPGAFDKLTTYNALTSELGSGLVPQNLGDPDLKPEISTEWEAGTELGFANGKIGFEATYWNRSVDDALVPKQFAWSGGFRATQLANIGKLAAHGMDLNLKVFPVNRQNVAVDFFVNGAYLFQKIESLGGAAPLKVGGSYVRYRNFLKEGYGPGALFGAALPGSCSKRPAGATYTCINAGEVPFDFNNDGKPDTEAEALVFLSSPRNPDNVNPIRYDQDKDGDFLDHYLGKPYPDWQGGFGGNLTLFKRWRFYSLWEYRGGDYTITDLTDAFRQASPTLGRNLTGAAQVEATLLNPASTAQQRLEAAKLWAYKYKALSPYDGLNQNKSGDFVRWREVSVTYDAPTTLASKLRVRDLGITLSARNVALWTKYDGIDPEVNAIGPGANQGGVDTNFLDSVDAFNWPIPRRFQLAARFSF
jgi:TonB-dependent starch-binding outer membrane protein SusC